MIMSGLSRLAVVKLYALQNNSYALIMVVDAEIDGKCRREESSKTILLIIKYVYSAPFIKKSPPSLS